MVTNTKTNEADSFIDSLMLPPVARCILRSNEDCTVFSEKYFGTNPNPIDDLLDYREDKIEKGIIDLNTFLEQVRENGIEATFESVFLQEFTTYDIEMIESQISKGVTSLEIIYRNFKSRPTQNIMRQIL